MSTIEVFDVSTTNNENVLKDATNSSKKNNLKILEKNRLSDIFSQLAVSDHSTPISTTSDELKSTFETPLKHSSTAVVVSSTERDNTTYNSEQRRISSNSDYSKQG